MIPRFRKALRRKTDTSTMLCADGNGVAVSTGPFWWPFYTTSANCNVNGIWGPNGGAITGTSGNGGFAAAEASAFARFIPLKICTHVMLMHV